LKEKNPCGRGVLKGSLTFLALAQELDRQQARKLVKQDTDREMQEFQMTVHRINKVLSVQASLLWRWLLLRPFGVSPARLCSAFLCEFRVRMSSGLVAAISREGTCGAMLGRCSWRGDACVEAQSLAPSNLEKQATTLNAIAGVSAPCDVTAHCQASLRVVACLSKDSSLTHDLRGLTSSLSSHA
jgi:hypothetical protein